MQDAINYLSVNQTIKSGTINNILHTGHNGDGFLKSGDKSYYFKIKNIINKNEQNLSKQKVLFISKENKYKGKTKNTALWILLIQNNKITWPNNFHKLQ